MRLSVFRRERFNAAHRIYRPEWSDERNLEVFGACANPNGHGHNYVLVVKVTGEVNPETGYVIDLKDLKKIVRSEVVDRFDHQNLNVDVDDFRELIPTAEHICFVAWNRIRDQLDPALDLQVRLYETERNFVEYPAG